MANVSSRPNSPPPAKSGTISSSVVEGYPIITISGYFDEEVGIKINLLADELLRSGKIWLLLDFANCVAVNSLGLGQLLELTLKVVEDFQGRLVLVQINRLMTRVFELGGITPPAEAAPNLDQAISLIKAPA